MTIPRTKGFGMMRIDAFWDGKTFKFVEINSDYPEGVVISQRCFDTYDRVMTKYKLIPKEYVWPLDNVMLFYQNMMTQYIMNGGKKKKPTIAIVGPKDRLFITEYNLLNKYFISKGHKSFLVTLNDLKNDKVGYLIYKGNRIDILRRAGEIRHFKKGKYCERFFKSYRNKKLFVMNTLHDRLIGIKSLFAILFDKNYQYLFTKKEKEVIRNNVPKTFLINSKKEIKRKYLVNKNRYVMKPSDLSEGIKLMIGSSTSQKKWDKEINNSSYRKVLQEKINIKKRPVVEIKEGKKIVKLLYTDINTHSFMSRSGKF
ncbi:hypothetical protein KJ782_05840, partial [Patescibacteria group bacterium]|nr:hypothetical protein [Patescibacteria group bacterium]